MKIKNRSGVTLTILVVTIIVMIILFRITYSTSLDLLKNSQKNKMKTMLYMVQSRAEILLDDFLFQNEGKYTIEEGEIVPTLKENEQPNTINYSLLGGTRITSAEDTKLTKVGVDSIGSGIVYCAWNKDVLEHQGIDTKNLAKGDTIIVKYDIARAETDVASTKGFSDKGVGIHFLSDFN